MIRPNGKDDKINFVYTHIKYVSEQVNVQGKLVWMFWKYWYLNKDIMAIERLDPNEHRIEFAKSKLRGRAVGSLPGS